MSKELASKVFELARVELSEIGWQKRKPGIFTFAINDDIIGWLGLNTAHYRGGIFEVGLGVGVRHQKLELMVAEFSGMKPHRYIPPSFGTNVGYLMPEQKYASWSFQEGNDCKAAVTAMVATVEKFARPFMAQNATLEAIYNTLLNSKRGTPPDQLDYRIAAASILLNKPTEAESFVDAKLREIGNRTDAAAEWFRNFAANLRAHSTNI